MPHVRECTVTHKVSSAGLSANWFSLIEVRFVKCTSLQDGKVHGTDKVLWIRMVQCWTRHVFGSIDRSDAICEMTERATVVKSGHQIARDDGCVGIPSLAVCSRAINLPVDPLGTRHIY